MAELKYLVRIANSDLKGSKPIGFSMLSIRGVGFSFANLACALAKINPMRKTGELTDKEVATLEAIILNPSKHGVPGWFLNRQRDYETGVDQHLIGPNIKFIQENDVRRLKKIKSYRGIRHALGLPTRGQKLRSNFRKNKGKTVGVMKSAAAKAAPSDDKKK